MAHDIGEAPVIERAFHTRDRRLDGSVIGFGGQLAHAHDRAGAGQQAIDDGSIGLLRVGLLRGTVDRLLHAAFGTRGAVSRLLTFSSRRGDAGRIRRCRVSRRW